MRLCYIQRKNTRKRRKNTRQQFIKIPSQYDIHIQHTDKQTFILHFTGVHI